MEGELVTPQTKIAVVIREDLATWQKLNVTAFVVSGIAATDGDSVGTPYFDASGSRYFPMFVGPVMVFGSTENDLRRAFDRATSRGVPLSIYTHDLFSTNNDVDNRTAVAAVTTDSLDLVGIAFRAERKTADKVLKGLRLHA